MEIHPEPKGKKKEGKRKHFHVNIMVSSGRKREKSSTDQTHKQRRMYVLISETVHTTTVFPVFGCCCFLLLLRLLILYCVLTAQNSVHGYDYSAYLYIHIHIYRSTFPHWNAMLLFVSLQALGLKNFSFRIPCMQQNTARKCARTNNEPSGAVGVKKKKKKKKEQKYESQFYTIGIARV